MSIADMAKSAPASGLEKSEACDAMDQILGGACSDNDIAEFLASLAKRGETDAELEGMLDSMMSHCVSVKLGSEPMIDVCGTGGDGAHTFNISTSAAFVAASAGARVAKHGNKSSSGGTGSADMFEQLGVGLDSSTERVAEMMKSHKIAFMFAPQFHPAVKNARAARKILAGTRTAFNLLGPLANPARVSGQLVGVSSEAHLERIPSILTRRGVTSVIAVRSVNGLDELSTSSKGVAIAADAKGAKRIEIVPADLGLAESSIDDLVVDGMDEAFAAFVGSIEGTAPKAMIETVALNAGVALIVAGVCESIENGFVTALEAVRSGSAYALLEGFTRKYGKPESLEKVKKC